MKKYICIIAIIMSLFALCACGEKTFDCSVAEMNVTIIDDLTEETDIKAIRQHLVDTEAVSSIKEAKEIFIDYALFYNDDCYLDITARLMPYNNDDIDSCIDDAYAKEIKYTKYEDIKVGSLRGKLFSYKMDGGKHDCLLVLNNGIYYDFDLSYADDIEYPDSYLKDIASTINFEPKKIGTKKTICGEVESKIPANYQELNFESTEYTYDEKWYGQYGENTVEFGVFNCLESEWGSVSEILDSMESTLDNTERSKEEFSLGTCEYLTGTNDGSSYICAVFEYNGKIYSYQMVDTETPDVKYISPIINSAKAK